MTRHEIYDLIYVDCINTNDVIDVLIKNKVIQVDEPKSELQELFKAWVISPNTAYKQNRLYDLLQAMINEIERGSHE